MEKDDKQKFIDRVDQIWYILSLAKDCYLYSSYLYNADTEKENSYISHSTDFIFIRHILLRVNIIELSKLYSSSSTDEFRLSKLISDLKESKNYLQYGIPRKSINDWLKELGKNKKAIDDFLILRNRIYAHTDKDWTDYSNIEIELPQIEKLVKLAELLIADIYKFTLKSDVDLEPATFDKERFNIIKILADAQKEELETSKITFLI